MEQAQHLHIQVLMTPWNLNKDLNVATVYGNVVGNVTGNVTGNSTTATTLQTARNFSIGGDATTQVSFDGPGDIVLYYNISKHRRNSRNIW